MNQAPDTFEINGFSSFAVTSKFSTRLVCFEAVSGGSQGIERLQQ
jgi:hypothetical protein